MVMVIILYRLQGCGLNTARFGKLVIGLYGMKIAVWLGIQVHMFVYSMEALWNCKGGMAFYVMGNSVLHFGMAVVVCCRKCR